MLNARMALARSLREGISAPENRVAGKLCMFAESFRSGNPGNLRGKAYAVKIQTVGVSRAT